MKNLTPVVAIIAIAGMEAVALFNGKDGYLMTLAVTAIAGIGGYKLNDIVKANKAGKDNQDNNNAGS